MIPLTQSLSTWTPAKAADAKDQVQAIEDHPGLERIREAVEARKLELVQQLAGTKPDDNASVYADVIGQIKGLGDFDAIIAGIIENGRKAEMKLREQN
jgi:hypothetical protein